MASIPQKQPEPKYVELSLSDVRETFADSVRFIGFDGQTWRIELTITRTLPELMEKLPKHMTDAQRQYPACRLVLTMNAGLELLNKLTQTAAAMEAQGMIKRNDPPAKPMMATPDSKLPH